MYYIGIDVHKKKCVTTIKGDAKKVLKRTSFDNDITGINGFTGMLRSDGYLPATAACESTGNYWIVLHDTLEAAGINTLLAHPYHLKIITQTAYKNDKADSEKLAELCRLDMIPESFVVNAAQRDMRELTRSRLGLVGDTVAPRNRTHAIVARYPYKRPSCGLFTDGGLEWLQSLSLSETDRLGVDTHLAKLVFLRGRIARYERRIAEIARDDPRARLIMTIPGIGYITAVTILAEIVDHGRFANAEKLVSYAGLSPKHHNSGGDGQDGQHNKARLRLAAHRHGRGRLRRRPARRPDRGALSKAGSPHRNHEGKGGHGQGHARMGLGDAQQRHRVQGNKSGSRQAEDAEDKAYRRVPGVTSGATARRGSRSCRHIGSSRIFDGLPAVARRGNHGSRVGGSQYGLRAVQRSRPGQDRFRSETGPNI